MLRPCVGRVSYPVYPCSVRDRLYCPEQCALKGSATYILRTENVHV